jgi:hypothetical protein
MVIEWMMAGKPSVWARSREPWQVGGNHPASGFVPMPAILIGLAAG